MEIIWAVLVWIVFGLICGAIARLLIPGRQSMGLAMTMVLGIIGSFVGGFIAYIITGGEPLQASGFLMSLIGAILVLAIYVYARRNRGINT
ncbi:MAG: GlsB/YeaQ/YmgE family stress response membrane protein [Pirellulales bacterium]